MSNNPSRGSVHIQSIISKYKSNGERKVHWSKPLVIKRHKVKRNAGDSRRSCWIVRRSNTELDALDIECDELLDSSRKHFRRISASIKESEIIAERIAKIKVIQAIDTVRDENERQRMMDQLDGASKSLMHLSHLNAQRMEMAHQEQNELNKLHSVVKGMQFLFRTKRQSMNSSAIGGVAPEEPQVVST